MDYCTKAQVQLGHPDLTASHVEDIIDDIVTEASQVVRDDIAGFLDIYTLDEDEDTPLQITRLAIYKARELGYRVYYGSGRVVIEEITYIVNSYDRLLNDIRDGRIEVGYRIKSDAPNNLRFI